MDKKKMSLAEKIDFLNNICDKSLSLLADSRGWSLHSYRDGTPFYGSPWLQAESLEKVTDLAIGRLIVDLALMKIKDKDENSK